MKPFLFLLLAAFIVLTSAPADAKNQKQPARNPVIGLWYTQDRDGVIELYSCENQICGRFHWIKNSSDNQPSLDNKNPDKEKRNRPLCGLQFMGGFSPKENGKYEDGWIYSPRHGGVFSANMTLLDHDTLDLHGYMFLPILGESQTWHRAYHAPACKAPKSGP